MAVFHTFCKNQLNIFVLILVFVFLAICVSCSNHHKAKLKENFAWMQDQQNQEEDEPIRYLIQLLSDAPAHPKRNNANDPLTYRSYYSKNTLSLTAFIRPVHT